MSDAANDRPTMADSSAPSTPNEAVTAAMDTPHCRAMRNLLGETVICTLDDGRTATGSLVCVDRLKNLILLDVTEERWVDSSIYAFPTTANKPHQILVAKRQLSQAMIPGSHLVRVQVTRSTYEDRVAPVVSSEEAFSRMNYPISP